MRERKQRLDSIMRTLEEAISHGRKRTRMDAAKMFEGLNKEEWEQALEMPQLLHLHLSKELCFDIKFKIHSKLKTGYLLAIGSSPFWNSSFLKGLSL